MLIQPQPLTEFTSKLFQAAGVPEKSAQLVANSLVGANLAGHDSHGVVRIMQYLDGIQAGEFKADAEPTIAHQKGAITMVDANFGFGQVAAHFAMTVTIQKARENGIAAAGLLHCNHVGRLGEWMEMAAAENMVGLAYCNGAGPGGIRRVSPFGSTEPILGTNPMSAAVPIGDHPPVVIDFATSVVAEGKVRVARNQGKQLPEGCILDADGKPSVTPQDLYDGGSLLPMAGHKGSGLSILMELIGGVLTGKAAPGSGQVIAGNGAVFIVLEVDAFRPFQGFLDDAASFYDHVKSGSPAPGFNSVLMPGEPEHQSAQRRRSEGIAVDETTWGLIVERAEKLGIAVPG